MADGLPTLIGVAPISELCAGESSQPFARSAVVHREFSDRPGGGDTDFVCHTLAVVGQGHAGVVLGVDRDATDAYVGDGNLWIQEVRDEHLEGANPVFPASPKRLDPG
jgi:hypothetical protein